MFDTNVIVAGIVADGLCREIVENELPAHEAVLSAVLWDELVAALERKFGLDVAALPILHLYRKHAAWVEPERIQPPVCRDADDDWVLATALAGGAQAIVTGDLDLLDLGAYRKIAVWSPREFLARLAKGAGS